MTYEKAISLIWAFTEVVEVDEWAKEDMANILEMTVEDLEEYLEEAIEDFNSYIIKIQSSNHDEI